MAKTTKKIVKRSPRVRKARAQAKSPRVAESVKSYVKKIVARNVEEKYQNADLIPLLPVMSAAPAPNPVQFGVMTLGEVFQNVTQGTGQGQRIGNEIILKKWVLRGCVVPNMQTAAAILGRQLGFLDLYIGYRKDFDMIDGSLTDLYQDGNNTLSPTGLFTDQLHWINKDLYVILKHYRVKLGGAALNAGGVGPVLTNNEYDATFKFSFDICSKAFKNYRVKYNDATVDPIDLKLSSLAVFTTWTNFDGTDTVAGAANADSFYQFQLLENIEYTDA